MTASTVGAFLTQVPRRVRFAVSAALVLFPVQVGLGAVIVSTEGAVTPGLHLTVAVGIFAALLSSLAWTLTATTRGEVETGQREKDIGGSRPNSKVRAYIAMTKPRLMWLLCLVAVAGIGLAVAAGGSVSFVTAAATVVGGCLAIGASGTFNQLIERDRDKRMARTSDRPMPNDLVPVRNAASFGVSLSALSAVVFVLLVNVVAMALTMVAIFFYSVVYTVILKPHTDQNVVIGGVVGALPALIGWAAVTGDVGIPALVLGGVIFLWTPAHFYSLALIYKDDYASADIPMLPVVRGDNETLRHITFYLGATLVGVSVLAYVSELGWLFAAVSVWGAVLFLSAVVHLHRERTRSAALRAFHSSNAFLGAVTVAVAVETLVL